MARCLIYQLSDGLVVNSVIWDGKPGWEPPEGHAAVFDDNGHIGQFYSAKTGKFTDPPLVDPVPVVKSAVERIVDALIGKSVFASSDKEAILTE